MMRRKKEVTQKLLEVSKKFDRSLVEFYGLNQTDMFGDRGCKLVHDIDKSFTYMKALCWVMKKEKNRKINKVLTKMIKLSFTW